MSASTCRAPCSAAKAGEDISQKARADVVFLVSAVRAGLVRVRQPRDCDVVNSGRERATSGQGWAALSETRTHLPWAPRSRRSLYSSYGTIAGPTPTNRCASSEATTRTLFRPRR